MAGKKGESHHAAKMTDEEVIEARCARAAGVKIKPLAEKFNVRRATMSRICTGVLWSHVGGPLTRTQGSTTEDRKR